MASGSICDDLEAAKGWARHQLTCDARSAKGVAAVVHAAAELPLSCLAAFQLMAHPDNARIFRGVERCTFRRILWAGDNGRQMVEVENESFWRFLFFNGSIRTRMLVHEDAAAGTMHIRLAPAGGNAPIEHMRGQWTFAPGSSATSCRVTLDQEVHPRGFPPFCNNAFRAMATLTVRKTFEDLYAEALRINAGRPSLPPYAQVARKELVDAATPAPALPELAPSTPQRSSPARAAPCMEDECDDDPSSVLAAYDMESSSSSSSSGAGAGKAPAMSGGPVCRPLGAALRSHPIGSLLDLASLDTGTDATPAAELAVTASAAVAENPGGAPALAHWRQRFQCMLERMWSVGADAETTAQLEEMSVLV